MAKKTQAKKKGITQAVAIVAADTYRKAQLDIEGVQAEVMNKQAVIANGSEQELANLAARRDKASETLEKYVEQNRDTMLNGGKSVGFAGVKVGYRKSAAKLVLTAKTTWEEVLEKLKSNRNHKKSFVSTSVAIDKKALQKADADVQKEVGVEVEQKENFFVKL